MEIKVNIELDQLIVILRKLPKEQLDKLLREVQVEKLTSKPKKAGLEELLLSGPIATDEQLEAMAASRKAINRWREN